MNANREAAMTLIEKYCNGTLSPVEFQQLQVILTQDREARVDFRRYLNLDSALRDLVEVDAAVSEWACQEAARPRVAAFPSWRRAASQAAIAAAFVALIGVAALMLRKEEGAAGAGAEGKARGFAVLTHLVDAQWAGDSIPLRPGDSLSARHIRLESGLAKIEFFSGATVILEGRSDFEITSSWEAICHEGKLRAQVPPAARGFTIKTAGIDVIDLGTEFGLEVSNGEARVHVFDGKVKLAPEKGEARELIEGNAVRIGGGGDDEAMAADSEVFFSWKDLEEKALDERHARFREWQEYSRELRRDPRLIAYFPMDQEKHGSRTVANATGAGASESDGAMVGVSRVTGRFGEPKSAVEFRKPGDRIRVFIPGEYASLTLACWVKLDSIDRLWNSLYLTDGYEAGEAHWQITHDRKLTYSMRIRGEGKPQNYLYQSPPIWDESMSGKWMHLATVYDVDRREVVHYVNGDEVSRESVTGERMVPVTRFGAGEIGNWGLSPSSTAPEFVVRSLNGLIDEFAVFSAALPGGEIRDMFEKGRP